MDGDETTVAGAGTAGLGIAGAVFAGATMLMVVELDAGGAMIGCPLEFVTTLAGFFSFAFGIVVLITGAKGTACWLKRVLFGAETAGAMAVVVGTGKGASIFGGRTCTTRCGATALCGIAGRVAAGGVGGYGVKTVGRGGGASLSFSGMLLGLFGTVVRGSMMRGPVEAGAIVVVLYCKFVVGWDAGAEPNECAGGRLVGI